MKALFYLKSKVLWNIGDEVGKTKNHILGTPILSQFSINLKYTRKNIYNKSNTFTNVTLHQRLTLPGSAIASKGIKGLTGKLVSNIWKYLNFYQTFTKLLPNTFCFTNIRYPMNYILQTLCTTTRSKDNS